MLRNLLRAIYRSKPVQSIRLPKPLLHWLLADATLVLIYHEISDAPSPFHARHDLNHAPDVFATQLQALHEAGFYFCSLRDMQRGDYRRPAVFVTFDDGAPGFFDNAIPILRRHGAHAINFLNASIQDGAVFHSALTSWLCANRPDFIAHLAAAYGPDWDATKQSLPFLFATPELTQAYLDAHDRAAIERSVRADYGPGGAWEQIQRHQELSIIHYGNHTYTHANAAAVSPEFLAQDVARNQERLDALPQGTRWFSYPYGQPALCYNEATHTVIRNCGQERLFESSGRIHTGPVDGLIHRFATPTLPQSESGFLLWLAIKMAAQRWRSRRAD
ncbi:polysaccharide deacetylase family protein [Magnetofaba australis]|uniref:polysaccharide deacetylase family protein n=1 Tax=Magnetofaba australis TaxID=1472297 RepID=UPI000A19F87E|nr:polysaccharide deacetylase family protein [Magnetofaba australis]